MGRLMRTASPLVKSALVIATMASLLVPAFTRPARAITVPSTLARSITTAGAGRASYSFPATHVAFSWTGEEGTGVRYRTIDGDGTASRWRRAAEAHDLEAGDDHYSGVIAVDRPDAIQWEPAVPPGKAMGDVTVDYMNALDGPRRRVEIPSLAGAEASDPDVITRAEWGADESIKRTSGTCKRLFYPLQQLFVHHTVGANNDPHPKATMRSMYYFHTIRRGWCDLGYNFVISPDGRIFEGRWSRRFDPWEIHDSENHRGEAVQGAHTSGYNSGSVAVSLMGNYSTARMTLHMRTTLVNFLAWEADRHNLRPKARHTYVNPATGLSDRLPIIAGHRDAGQTECPGNSVYRALPNLRDQVRTLMADGKANTRTILASFQPTVPQGGSATFTGRLSTAAGEGLAGRAVAIHVKPENRRWRDEAPTVTTIDGEFSFSVTAGPRDFVVVAEFEGDLDNWRSQSERVPQSVTPVR